MKSIPTFASERIVSQELTDRTTGRRTEVGLNVGEGNHTAVSASTLVRVQGETDGVVEGQAESLMRVIAALVLEQVVLDVLEDGEENTAGLVSSDTAAGASDTLRNRG